MKKLILPIVLLLCLAMLTSCAAWMQEIGENASLDQLDAKEREFLDAGYTYTRADEAETISFGEGLVAETGLILKGKLTGKIEYEYTRSETGEFVWGIVIGTTCREDSDALAGVYETLMDYQGVDLTVKTYYVQIEYTF